MDEYKNLIDDVFESPDKIIQDVENNEFLYLKGNNLLRVTINGEFVSLYSGAESGKVLSAIEIWKAYRSYHNGIRKREKRKQIYI